MAREIDDTSSNRSILLHALKTVTAREQALNDLKKLAQRDRHSISRQELADKLTNLRTLSLNTVDLIQSWREKLATYSQNLLPSKIQFMVDDENYLVKMKNDTTYLSSTVIAELIYISPKSDPFFVYSSSTSLGKAKSPGKLELPIASSLLSRIRKCEMILLEEGVTGAPVRENIFELRNKAKNINLEPMTINSDKENEASQSSRRSSRQHNRSNRSLFSRDNSIGAQESPEESKIHITQDVPVASPASTERLVLESLNPVNIEDQIENYSLKVPDVLKEALGKPESAYINSQSMRYPAYLWVKNDKNIIGFVILNLENQKSMQKRLMISHISAESLKLYSDVLALVIDYIWNNYPCIEVRIGMISKVNEQGKYEADKSVKEFFDKLGFRWKQMIYTGDKTPLQLLGLRRPDTVETPQNIMSQQLFGDCMEISYACAAQVSHESRNIPTQSPYFSLLGIACALRSLDFVATDGSSLGHKIQDLISKMQVNWIPPAFRFRKEKYEGAMNDLKSIGLSLTDFKSDCETSVSCSALGLSWGKYQTSIINGVLYTRVHQTQVNIMRSGDSLAYIVPTEDPNFSCFFIPTNDREGAMAFNTAKEVLSRIERVEDTKEEIWIPSFVVNQENKLGELINSKVGELNITSCSEIVNLKFLSPLHPKGSLLTQPEANVIILDSNFIFGIMHNKVDEELEVPFFVTYVTRGNFSKAI